MKHLLTLLIAAFLFSCNTEKSILPEPSAEFARLDSALRRFEKPASEYTVPSDKPFTISGKSGLVMQINPEDLVTEDGQPLGSEIRVVFRELTTRQSLVRSNVPTVSDGKLLVTGGAFFIGLSSGGKNLKMKEGKTYQVEFPVLSDDEMSLFYGERDSSGNVNWKPANQNLTQLQPDTSSTVYEVQVVTGSGRYADTVAYRQTGEEFARMDLESRKGMRVYAPVALEKFGWINCDRFLNNPNPVTVSYTITNEPSQVNYIRVYMIFEDIESVMPSEYYAEENKIIKDDFLNIPTGQKVKLLAVGMKAGKFFSSLTDTFTVSDHMDVPISLEETDDQKYEELMSRI